MVGPIWHWLGLLEWIGLVKALVRHQVPLFDALRLSANSVSDPSIAQVTQGLADGVARGRSLSQTMQAQRAVPASLVPLVRWGEEAGMLAESLDIGSEMLQERVRLRSHWLHMAVPPILLITIASGIPLFFGALVLPLISLISSLTGGH